MIRIVILLGCVAVGSAVRPAAAMPPEALVAEAVDASPMVQAAHADLARARATADRLRVGEYEIVVSGSGGRRAIDTPIGGQSEFAEWNAGLSRTMRLPAKRRTDKSLADLEIQNAQAAYDSVRRSALLEFVTLWTNWRSTVEGEKLARRLADDATKIADAEEQAVSLGASRQIYADQLRSDASLFALEADRRMIEAENAKANLATAFPDLVLPTKPGPLRWGEARRASLLAMDDGDAAPSVRAAQASLSQMEMKARRARLDRLPDPTLGLQVANEFGGAETSLMATVSVPIGGRARRASAKEAASIAKSALADLRAEELDAQRRYDQAKRAAVLAGKNQKNTEEAARRARSASDRLAKGYAMGAVNLGDLVATRRALTLAERALIDYRIEAERAYLVLAVMNDAFAQKPGAAALVK